MAAPPAALPEAPSCASAEGPWPGAHAWQLFAVPPGTPRAEAQACSVPRHTLHGPLLSVAAALRAAGAWSLDAPDTLRLDAWDWWYRVPFDLPEAADAAPWAMKFDGLATQAEVWLDDTLLLVSQNMHREHLVALPTDAARPGGHVLWMRFASLDAALAARRPRPRWKVPMLENQQLRWWRTSVLGRTPGWSPPAPVIGPWRAVSLMRSSPGEVEVRRLLPRVEAGRCWVEVEVAVPAQQALSGIRLSLVHEGQHIVQALRADITDASAGYRPGAEPPALVVWRADVEVPDAARWWPHTHGRPALYQAQLELQRRDGAPTLHPLGDIGFRDVVREPGTEGLALRVNGEPIFCRGAVWTPLDALQLAATPEALRQAVAQVARAGMNMLRVPGTQALEEPAFYAACDELGVMVWQDFAYANMDYPFEDAAFEAEAQAEARQHLARLQPHASVVLLCGNSEVEQQAAMWGASRELWQPPWFHATLPALCAQACPGTPYWPSSAHGGAFPHQPSAGSTSYYGVGAYLRGPEDARASDVKFASECLAFANVPDEQTLQRMPGGAGLRMHHAGWKARSPRDLGAGWDFDDVRDHYLARLFHCDVAALRYADHARYLMLARLASAQAMTLAMQEWRRARSACGGALVLFLRDLWAGAGWGLLSDDGAPKAAFHALSQVLQPLHLSLSDEGCNGLAVHWVNETAETVQAQLELTLWRDGETAAATEQRPVILAPRQAHSEPWLSGQAHFSDTNHAYRFGPLRHVAASAVLRGAQGEALAQALWVCGPSALLPTVREVGLQVQIQPQADGSALAVVSTRALAQWVHFDVPGYRADDEFFHLLPGAQRSTVLRPVAGLKRGAGRPPAGQVWAANADTGARI